MTILPGTGRSRIKILPGSRSMAGEPPAFSLETLQMDRMIPTITGLIIALFGPAVVGLAGEKLMGKVTPLAENIAAQIALLLVLAAVLAIVVRWEHQPLASIGIRPPKLSSLVWGLLLAALFVFVYSPALFWVLNRLGQGGF